MQPDDPILIAILPTPADLARAQEGWYRIPMAFAPASLPGARALVFYQPAAFGEARWQVAWWATVRSVGSCLRRELIPAEAEHRRANEPYACVRLGPVRPVEPPKRSLKGRRLLFVPTTWGDFEAAATVDELVARAPRPVADDPLYALIRQQIEGVGGLPDPGSTHQRRLFEPESLILDGLEW